MKRRASGYLAKPEKIICPRDESCDRVTLREDGQVGLVHVVHVIERCRLVAKQRPKPRFAELPHMCADGEIVLLRSRKNLRRLSGAEGSAIAEHVHELREFALRDRRHHFVADQVNVFLRTSAILRRDRVRAQKSRNHCSRPLRARPRGWLRATSVQIRG